MLDSFSSWSAWYLGLLVVYGAFLAAIAAHDVRRHRIPNRAVYPALLVAVALSLVRPGGPWWSFLAAGLLAGLLLVALAVVSNGGIGFGDAKLAALVGVMAGWPDVLVALFVAFASGALAAIVLLAAGRIGRRDPLPFGPALAAGAVAALLGGPQLRDLLWPALAS